MLFGLLLGLILAEVALQIGAAYLRSTQPSQPTARETSRRRVICLGDSNMYGLWVERDQTFPHYLAQVWEAAAPERPVEVLNLGFPGLNSSKLRKSFAGLVGALRPELVLVLVGSNDVTSVPVPLDDPGPNRVSETRYALWQSSRVFRLLYMLVAGVREQTLEVDMHYTPTHRRGVVRVGDEEFDLAGTDRQEGRKIPEWAPDLQQNLRAMAADASAAGAAFVVLTYPSPSALYGLATSRLRLLDDLPIIDLSEIFRRICGLEGNCPDLLFDDQHPTPAGNQLMAAVVLAGLRQLGLAQGSADLLTAVTPLEPFVQRYFQLAVRL